MIMKLISTVSVVRDINKSKKFYEDLLDQEATVDPGINIFYDGFTIQSVRSWTNFLNKEEGSIKLRKHNGAELYFEGTDFNNFIKN